MNDRNSMCGLCDTYHVPGECPEGAPVPQLDFCPWCARSGDPRRGKGLLVTAHDANGKAVQVCCLCPFGRQGLPRAKRRRGTRGGRGRVKR